MHRTWLEVSLRQINANYRAVRRAAGPEVAIMPVVKADAYRHGAVEVSRTLERAGARWFAVSSVQEGVQLRESGVQARILVMADSFSSSLPLFCRHRLTPALHSLTAVREFERFVAGCNQSAAFHLKIDSGMGRLGTRATAAEILAVLSECRATQCEGLMTHFASSSDYAGSQTDEQIASFTAILEHFRASGFSPQLVHLSSTAPVAYGRKEAWGNLVRPGHAIYGYVSPAKGNAPVKRLDVAPALAWKARILEIKDLPANSPVGYGAIYRTARPSRIAILAVGYADGLPHRLSNKGKVLIGGAAAPILGAVSMDVTTIDITGIPGVDPSGVVTLLGKDGKESIDAQQMARIAGTISYSVLCGISTRVVRIYV